MPAACLDLCFLFHEIRRHFGPDGWTTFEHVHGAFGLLTLWMYEICSLDFIKMNSVFYKCCVQWVHTKCIDERNICMAKFWIGKDCFM